MNDRDEAIEGQTISPVPQKDSPQLTYLFLDALKFVREGKRITKLEWGDKDIYGVLRFDKGSQATILMLHKSDDTFWSWTISEDDFVGDDWVILPEGN